mgnify:CR=1 FL=1
MISYLKGTVILKNAGSIIINVQGVGYKVFLAPQNLQDFQEGELAAVFCFLYVKEDRMELYGFKNPEQLQMFEVLNTISGVGPKAGLALSSLGSIEEFQKAIKERNEQFFAGTKGIGKKKIQKIIVELTGKLDDFTLPGKERETDEAVYALVRLGFSASEARNALQEISPSIQDVQQRIKEALKLLGKR